MIDEATALRAELTRLRVPVGEGELAARHLEIHKLNVFTMTYLVSQLRKKGQHNGELEAAIRQTQECIDAALASEGG